MLRKYNIKTDETGLYNITSYVRQTLNESGVESGIAVVFCPHTTAAITINENADPDVQTDLLFALDKTYPDRPQFRHMEGNSAAHLRSSCVGASETVIIEDGSLLLGTWQGIYFAEFDGPRTRTFYVKIVKG
ncbi:MULTISPECIES: secondary thiamine-phosphate synthase enzyme YjbQ [Ruminococcus]|jgi:secondary thiamine-phosphate synthase enzyme|uniref:Secondary thiamine-phosphate synthase enzyme n=1 Tax=Ruminococcus albus 8 TaxID=246199 RepID=E9SHN2_RUMAL|nr:MULTISPECIES: secondary thiamine-phosphate synthase enzyme YjbQ [Ruminococcus]MBE6874092.1 YjbQ family protein [Ruminococcus albus]EGC01190.1 secondary thiamine-phosphate synthase enzyme [Ruminococcus albus 8]MBO5559227.1 YjbQ family protein [Ruminococcus sp.]MBQ9541397.1 YjbQ family protein [Ruminococcus sp.]MBR0529931.1 YjbQ family protein [Ruminococcus sp.]